jgi:predicted CoA-binding protein
MLMTDHALRAIFESSKTIAVVGLSDKPDRDSYRVAKYLQAHGYRIIPVNPAVAEVLGERSYASVADIPEPVDVVDIFRKPEAVGPVVEEAIAAGAKVVWMQLGVVNDPAAAAARAAGLQVVMDRCMKVEHRRLIG